jgi:hypothetical protein
MRPIARVLILLICPLAACGGWRAERAAYYKCEKGLSLLKECEDLWTKGDLTPEERQDLFRQLTKARNLLRDGMESFAEANNKTGKQYDVTAYLEAMKVARMKIMELRD